MSTAVLNQARHTLDALEAQATASQWQVDLFAAAPVVGVESSSTVEAAVEAMYPDAMIPREAMEALYPL
jgi:DNA mismatch repair protein MutS